MPLLNYADSLRVGNAVVDKVYKQSTLVYQKKPASVKPFLDNFNRADELLGASPHWQYYGGLPESIAAVRSNKLASLAQASDFGVQYCCPDQESLDQYVQFTLSQVGNPQSIITLRTAPFDNFIGILNAGTNLLVIRYINAVGTTMANYAVGCAIGDTIRMECVGANFQVFRNGSPCAAATPIGHSFVGTRQGVIFYGNTSNPFIDDWEAGAISAPPVVSYADTFNRANANLEASATASGGWTWTHDGLIAGAITINSNVGRGNTTDTAGSAYKAPDLGTADHYVEYKVGVLGTSGAFACCRLQDRNNFIGVRNDGSQIEVYRRNAGTLNNRFTSSSGVLAVGDVVRLRVTGNTWTVTKNGGAVSGGSGTIDGTTLTATQAGLVGRSTTGQFFDEFGCGT